MNEQQPNALRLADALIENADLDSAEGGNPAVCRLEWDAAAELRRLHALNAEMLAALQTVVANAPDPYCAITRAVDAQCRAAIANATGER